MRAYRQRTKYCLTAPCGNVGDFWHTFLFVIPLGYWQTFVAPTETQFAFFPIVTTFYRTRLLVKWECENIIAVLFCVFQLKRNVSIYLVAAFGIHAFCFMAWLKRVTKFGGHLVWKPETPPDRFCENWQNEARSEFNRATLAPQTIDSYMREQQWRAEDAEERNRHQRALDQQDAQRMQRYRDEMNNFN